MISIRASGGKEAWKRSGGRDEGVDPAGVVDDNDDEDNDSAAMCDV